MWVGRSTYRAPPPCASLRQSAPHQHSYHATTRYARFKPIVFPAISVASPSAKSTVSSPGHPATLLAPNWSCPDANAEPACVAGGAIMPNVAASQSCRCFFVTKEPAASDWLRRKSNVEERTYGERLVTPQIVNRKIDQRRAIGYAAGPDMLTTPPGQPRKWTWLPRRRYWLGRPQASPRSRSATRRGAT